MAKKIKIATPDTGGKATLNPALKEFWKVQARNRVLIGGRSSSKCLALGTMVIMHDGYTKPVERVTVGDKVMGANGCIRNVMHTTKGVSELFQVSQSFGMDYVVNEDHILSLRKSESAKRDGRYPDSGDIINVPVKEFMSWSDRKRNHFKGYRVGFEFEHKELEIPPYLLGMWLGDGNKDSLSITTEDAEIVQYIHEIAESRGLGVNVNTKENNSASTYRIFSPSKKPFPLWESFRSQGIVAERYENGIKLTSAGKSKKSIPLEYMTASRNQRLEILAGIIDSDGTYSKDKSCFVITQKDELIARDIHKLASWLGFPALISTRKTKWTHNGVTKTGECFNISISGDISTVPNKLPRKQALKKPLHRNKNGGSSVLKVKSLGSGDYAGFSIDGDHLFCLEDGTVTHNSWDAAGFAIFLANTYNVRFLCARQIQSKIEESVYTLLKVQIARFGLQNNFDVLKNKIVNKKTGSEFIFYGLWRHIEEIKSLEGIDVCWIEEAHSLTRAQWEILEPTIRKENSQFWLLFNPDLVTDFVYQHFVINTPPDTIVRHINYDENPFLSNTILKVIDAKKNSDYEDYEHTYLGVAKSDDEMAIIKRSWINAAVDAHLKLGFKAEGSRVVGYDVADAGEDTNATAFKHGSVLLGIDEWQGKEDELLKSSARAYGTAQGKGASIIYDSIGVGASVGSNIAQLNRDASNRSSPNLAYAKFAASGAVIKPKKEYEYKVLNKDMFGNLKAQAWWALAKRFRNTYNAIQDGEKFDPSEMISISSSIEDLESIKAQLSTPRQDRDNTGKVKVESKVDLKKRGVKSPNLADAIVMAFSENLVGFRTKHSYGASGTRTF